MDPALYIARRYLFAKKSHNVINVISAISAAGMAIGTAAIVLILSVYNGFDGIIKNNLSDLDPDILIAPSEGKYLEPFECLFEILNRDPEVESARSVLQDNVFVTYGEQQGLALAKGIELTEEKDPRLSPHIIEGEYALHYGDIPAAAVGATLACQLGIRPRFIEMMKLYYPEREGSISLANPISSLRSCKVKPSCLFSVTSDIDARQIIVPIETMHELIGDDEIVSGIEVRLKDNSRSAVKSFVRRMAFGKEYRLLDRYMQHPAIYKMMKYEKLAIFLILIFVVIIVAFNIFGSLSMLMIEKKEDIRELEAMGASKSLIRRIFILEGWLISLLGLAAGLVVGIGLAIIQQRTGMVKMPGNYLIDSYPVVLQWSDTVITAAGVAIIGFVISLIASARRMV